MAGGVLEVGVVELFVLEAVELLLFGRICNALEQFGGIDVHVPPGLVAVDQVVRENVDFHFLGFLDLDLEWHLSAYKLDCRTHTGKEGHVLDDDGRVL